MMATTKHTDKLWETPYGDRSENSCLLYFWCPGCGHCHAYEVPRWSFNGDYDKPTFAPSLRVYTPAFEDRPEKTYCHLHVREGRIEYCDDCPHKLNGQTIEMQPIPVDYGGFD